MEADEHVLAVADVAVGEHQVHLARRALEGPQVELPGPGRQDEAGDLLGLHHDGRISHVSGTQSPPWWSVRWRGRFALVGGGYLAAHEGPRGPLRGPPAGRAARGRGPRAARRPAAGGHPG